jgi:predicted transposase YbfD/YdcC
MKALHKAVETFFFKGEREGFSSKACHRRTCEKGHGRLETREPRSVPAEDLALPGVEWPQLRSVTLIRRTREIKGVQAVERHYFLSSLAPAARRIEEAVREHWQVENGLYWSLDVQMGEDDCAVHDEIGTQNLASLRRLTLARMMLKRGTKSKRRIEAKSARAARNTEHLEHPLILEMARCWCARPGLVFQSVLQSQLGRLLSRRRKSRAG